VTFTSSASNLDPSDIDAFSDVFVKNLASGDLTLVSTSKAGVKQNGGSVDPDLSRDANLVIFTSTATNLDPADVDTTLDIYAKNVSTGDISLASSSDSGVKGNNHSSDGIVAPSGLRVAFSSQATNLDSADSDAVIDVYVKTLATEELDLVSASDSGVKGNATSGFPALSGSGLRVAFQSNATNLDPADTDPARDIYVKNLVSGDLTLVSTSDSGVKGNASSSQPTVSSDGTRVTFESIATNLDPSDTDPDLDVYVKDLDSGDIALVSTTPGGSSGDGISSAPSLSGDGFRVAFQSTATTLEPSDTDSTSDVYVGEPFLCTAVGTSGNDVLTGTNDRDVLCGQGGADTLVGRGGNDVLLGGNGDDVLDGGPGADDLDGGHDTDTLTFAGSSAGVEVYLAEGSGIGGDADGDVLAQIENVEGSPAADSLFGDADVNELSGADGSDIVSGAEGDDVLAGDGGDDFLIGGPGADDMAGGLDSDTVTYSESPAGVNANLTSGTASGGNAAGDTFSDVESLGGSALADTLTGNASGNTLIGGAGDDVLTGLGGGDVIEAGSGTDAATYIGSPAGVVVELANNLQAGGHATGDSLSSVESLVGSAFRDVLTGTDSVNVLRGEGGDDVLTGLAGNDTLVGAEGIDRFSGGSGTDGCDDVAGERTTSCDP